MRMFLVGMCDIFLILYLTTLGQVDRSKVSDLTVADYMELRALAEERSHESKQQLAALQQKLQEQEGRVKLSGDELQALKQRLEKERASREKVEEVSAEAKKRLEDLRKQREELLAGQQETSSRLEKVLSEKGELAETVTELKQSVEKSETEKRKLDELMASLKIAEEKSREAAQKAKEEAEKAAKEAEIARQEKERARMEADEARKIALDAEVRKQEALTRAREASGVALEARIEAIKATEKAEFQTQRAKKATTELKAVIEPSKKAYSDRIGKSTHKVRIEIEVKNRLVGRSKEELSLRLLSASWGKEVLLFVPFDQVGLRDVSAIKRFTRYRMTVDGKRVSKLYVRPSKPSLIAIVVPDPLAVRLELKKDLKADALTPTLFSVRNGSRMKFSDRMRNLDEDYFVFKRDRLTTKSGLLHLSVEGFRGTRDYGERIVSGDQVVDLRGNLVGIATAENTVLLLDDLESWLPVEIQASSPTQGLNSLWAAIGE